MQSSPLSFAALHWYPVVLIFPEAAVAPALLLGGVDALSAECVTMCVRQSTQAHVDCELQCSPDLL